MCSVCVCCNNLKTISRTLAGRFSSCGRLSWMVSVLSFELCVYVCVVCVRVWACVYMLMCVCARAYGCACKLLRVRVCVFPYFFVQSKPFLALLLRTLNWSPRVCAVGRGNDKRCRSKGPPFRSLFELHVSMSVCVWMIDCSVHLDVSMCVCVLSSASSFICFFCWCVFFLVLILCCVPFLVLVIVLVLVFVIRIIPVPLLLLHDHSYYVLSYTFCSFSFRPIASWGI